MLMEHYSMGKSLFIDYSRFYSEFYEWKPVTYTQCLKIRRLIFSTMLLPPPPQKKEKKISRMLKICQCVFSMHA